jgi:hypothetical protein
MSRKVIARRIGRRRRAARRWAMFWRSERSQTLTGGPRATKTPAHGMTTSRRREHPADVRALEMWVTVKLTLSLARASKNMSRIPPRAEGRSLVNPWGVGHVATGQLRWWHNQVDSRQVVG